MNTVTKLDCFDKRMDFDKDCKHLLDELTLACSLHKIPFFFTACVANDFENSDYVSDGVVTGSRNIHLADDHIVKHLAVVRGFEVVPSRQDVEINMDEIDFPD